MLLSPLVSAPLFPLYLIFNTSTNIKKTNHTLLLIYFVISHQSLVIDVQNKFETHNALRQNMATCWSTYESVYSCRICICKIIRNNTNIGIFANGFYSEVSRGFTNASGTEHMKAIQLYFFVIIIII